MQRNEAFACVVRSAGWSIRGGRPAGGFDQAHGLLTAAARERIPPDNLPVALFGHGAQPRTEFLFGEVDGHLEWSLRDGPQHDAVVPALIRSGAGRAAWHGVRLVRARGVWRLDGWSIDDV